MSQDQEVGARAPAGTTASGIAAYEAVSSNTAAPEDPDRARRLRIALAIIVACQLMVTLDATIVNIALPKIQNDLGFSPIGLSWVLNSYTLIAGGLLLLGGRFGDVYGRRRMFISGLLVFTVASLLGGLAPSSAVLLLARALQGVGAAMAAPASLSLIINNFREGPERNRALGGFSSVAGLGLTLGLILGGLLAALSWRLVFFINLPIGLLAVGLARSYLQETERHPVRFDLPGAITSTMGTAALVFGFIRAASNGWSDQWTVSSFIAGIVLLVAFVVMETKVAEPIMSLGLLANRARAGAYLNMLLMACSLSGTFFFLSQFVQDVLGFGTVEAGAAFLPLAATQFVSARSAPKLLPKFGPKIVSTSGVALALCSSIWMTQLTADSSYLTGILGPTILFGVGVGLCFMPLNSVIMGGLPRRETGAASGLLQSLQRSGGALGVAVLVTVFGTALGNARRHPVGGLDATGQAQHALAHGIATAFIAGSLFMAAALLVCIFLIKVRPAARPNN